MAIITLVIDGKEVKGEQGDTILEICERNGIDVPTLCHFEGLTERGLCRMCLVEAKGERGFVPACTTEARNGMEVTTENEKLTILRRANLELLFSEKNHFCMFCETSGDCELQNLAYRYGMDHVRYDYSWPKLPVDATRKYFLFDQNRCILCRRCVRACDELAGHGVLGLKDRGPKTLVCADLDYPFGESTCVSCGTCLQVCPTGALVDKKSAYLGREIHFDRTKSTCTFCSVGCGIDILTREDLPVRIEGDWEAEPNRGILCVAGRFEPLYETRKRIKSPMARRGSSLVEVPWEEALNLAAEVIISVGGPSATTGIISPRATNEAAFSFKKLFDKNAHSTTPYKTTAGNGKLSDIEEGDWIFIAGTDLDEEFNVVSSFVKRAANRGAKVTVLGSAGKRVDKKAAKILAEDDVANLEKLIVKSERPVFVWGPATHPTVVKYLHSLKNKIKQIGLAAGANSRGLEKAGIKPLSESSTREALYLLIADDVASCEVEEESRKAKNLIIQSSYVNEIAERADVIFPSPPWFERSGTYTNTEGRLCQLNRACEPPEGALPDEEIVDAVWRLLR
jgi:formate dehydrogenase major subunit